MKKITLLLIIVAALFVGCDKIEGPYITLPQDEEVTVTFPDVNPAEVYRKILLEEYTGHLCTNCPAAHVKLEELHNTFHDTLVIVGIHATSLATATPSGLYSYDFRTEAGNELAADFNINSIPAGIINRHPHNGDFGPDNWYSKIVNVDRSKVYAAIQLINQYGYPTAGELKINAKVTMLDEYEHPVNFSLFLVEDGIIKPQYNNGANVEDYTHNHVLRAGVNGTYGAYLSETGVLEKDNAYTYGYSISFNDKDWVPENCQVVAVLFDKANGEVLQVEKVSVR